MTPATDSKPVARNVWPEWAGWRRHFFDRPFFDLDLDREGWLRVEEFRDGDTLVIRAELPDVDPDKDVTVTVADGIVRIEAKREEKEEHRGKDGYRSELRYGSFSRELTVPTTVTSDDVKATYKDGILEVRVPLPTETAAAEAAKVAISRS